MGKKFSILKSIDTNELDKQIKNYQYETGETPYLFMSNRTGYATERELAKNFSIPYMSETDILKLRRSNNVVLGEYKGCKIYENNDLAFGEVEIR